MRFTELENQTLYYAFTLNKYSEEQVDKLKHFIINKCYRGMWGYEKGDLNQTPHLQGCFQLLDRQRPDTVKKLIDIPQIHLESQRKVYLANANYCKKSENCWYWPNKECNFEKGKPLTKKSDKYDNALLFAKKGQFDKIEPELILKYENKLIKTYLDNLPVDNTLLDNKYGNFFNDFFILIHGPTGTGKSYSIEMIQGCLNLFWKSYCQSRNLNFNQFTIYYKKCNKWWDGYTGQQIVVLEEIEPSWSRISGNLLKQLCDQYPFPVEIKGSSINKIRPLFVILTSNYNLKQLCSKDDGTIISENYEPLKRRLFIVELNSRFDFFNWPRYDHLTTYFDTHEEVKKEKQEEIKRRHYRLIEENCTIKESSNEATFGSSTPATLTDENTESEPILIEENENTQLYDDLIEYSDEQLKRNQTIQLYVINQFNFTFKEENNQTWRDINFFKSMIKAYKCLINLNKSRILILYDDIDKINKRLLNLNEGYKFIQSILIFDDEGPFSDNKEKQSSLLDIMTQIRQSEEEKENTEQEIQHFLNLNTLYNNKIWEFKLEINNLLIDSNNKLKSIFSKIVDN